MTSRRLQHTLRRTPLALCLATLLSSAVPATGGEPQPDGVFVTSPSILDLPQRSALPVARQHSATGSSLVVTSCADDGSAGTLRSVVAGASSGDTVDLSSLTCSTITLASGAIAVNVDDLTLQGPGFDALTIDGANSSPVITHNATPYGPGVLSINDLTIADGRNDAGFGGCISSTANLSLVRAKVTGCSAGNDTVYGVLGGGISVAYGDLSVTSSVISGNIATADHAVRGGGAFCGGNLTVVDSSINGNSANATGGAYTLAYGGGAFAGGSFMITDSTIAENSADFGGGLLSFTTNYAYSSTITNSTISGNTAMRSAGGVRVSQPLILNNSTIAFNSAVQGAGGVLLFSSYASTFQSSVVASNLITGGSPIYAADLGSASSYTPLDGASNLITSSDVPLPSDTLDADPQLQPLTDNGGPTLTHALPDGSPAIDTGNNTAGLEFDQRGDGFPRVSGAAADIGAFERQAPASIPPTLAKDFTPTMINLDGASSLTLTLSNANGIPATLTAALIDVFPEGLVVATPSNAATTCTGGSVTATAGSDMLVLASGASIPAAGDCTVSVSVSGDNPGTFINTIPAGSLQTDQGSNADPASAGLTVNAPPTLSKDFTPTSIIAQETGSLTITLGNANKTAATLQTGLIDILPQSVVVAKPADVATTCANGTVDAAGDIVILEAGAQIPAAGQCTVTVSITSDVPGDYTNVIPAGSLQTNFGSNETAASADLTVTERPVTDRIFADGFDGNVP